MAAEPTSTIFDEPRSTWEGAPFPRAAGVLCAVLGLAAIVASFLGLRWFVIADPDAGAWVIHFDALDYLAGRGGVRSHTQEAAVMLLVVTIAGLVVANLPGPARLVARAVAIVAGLGGVVLCLSWLHPTGSPELMFAYGGGALPATAAGFWAAVVGFALLVVAAVVAPRRPGSG